ncbi:PF11146 family protein [Leptospira broomii serovar Hurstbridge str. 5399]|uniref:PF11146 family protein n=1 Tax=Leptospira broomii serovar Hurstbridge str. 5399 TaxID=1049789 RepID=T0FE83_9LEPT|nr:DUF2905 domain-containing protein [Leptospira broomii]EQA45922.1 PF11146 family protein [Leptospira broomii serovar Hurstbridge str. 5399]
MEPLGKTFLWIGAICLLLGIFFIFGSKIPFLSNFGNLPGDIRIERDNFRFYFPITTSILVSIILSAILYLWNRIAN